MKSTNLRYALRAGFTFAILIIFLILIAFDVTASSMIDKAMGIDMAKTGAKTPTITSLIFFLSLIGLWNGGNAGRGQERLGIKVLAGLVAGLICGLLVGVFSFGLGTLNARGIDIRVYLSALSPDSVNFLNYGRGPLVGAFLHVVLLTVSGVAGGLLTWALGQKGWRRALSSRLDNAWSAESRSSFNNRISRSPIFRYVGIVLLLTILAILPRQWGSYWNYVFGIVGIYIILGLGLNIIVGLSGQLVLGFVAFFAIGAYSFALLTAPEPHHLQWNFWVALVVAVILSALTGILLGLPLLRLRGDYLAIVTLGFGEIIRTLLRSDLMIPLTAGPRGVRDIAGPTIFGHPFNTDVDYMYLIILAVLLTIFITQRLQYARVGRAWVSIREDETVARATGVDTFKYKLIALALGAAFAGIGGVLFASKNQFTGPEDHVLMVSINVLCIIVVGGMGSIPGVILGAFTLKGLPEILRDLELYRLLAFGALLVVMMILRPSGLWPVGRPHLETEITNNPPDNSSTQQKGEPV